MARPYHSIFTQFLWAALFIGLLSGCSSVSKRTELAASIASQVQLRNAVYLAHPFYLTAYERISSPGEAAHIYIEGDGLAWISKRQVSMDPTPTNPVALSLAQQDKSANVIYLARPCQYTKWVHTDMPCPIKYWTSHRYSEEVVNSYDQVLSELKVSHGFSGFHVTGFSGGAAIASLIAARRDDVLTLRSIGGNLDHEGINNWHKVTLMPESLNPIDYAHSLGHIPQIHYIGAKDKIVPTWISKNFIKRLPHSDCAEQVIVQDLGHEEGWSKFWALHGDQLPQC